MSTNPTFIQKYFQMVVTRPWTVIAVSALVLFASAAFLPTMVMDTRSDAFIDVDEPSLVYREKVEELFGLADPIVIAVTPDYRSVVSEFPAQVLISFDQEVDASTVNTLSFRLTRSGGDGRFDDGNEEVMSPTPVSISNANTRATKSALPRSP